MNKNQTILQFFLNYNFVACLDIKKQKKLEIKIKSDRQSCENLFANVIFVSMNFFYFILYLMLCLFEAGKWGFIGIDLHVYVTFALINDRR